MKFQKNDAPPSYEEDTDVPSVSMFDTSVESNMTSIINNIALESIPKNEGESLEEDIDRLMLALSEVTKQKDSLHSECKKYRAAAKIATKSTNAHEASSKNANKKYTAALVLLTEEKERNTKIMSEIDRLKVLSNTALLEARSSLNGKVCHSNNQMEFCVIDNFITSVQNIQVNYEVLFEQQTNHHIEKDVKNIVNNSLVEKVPSAQYKNITCICTVSDATNSQNNSQNKPRDETVIAGEQSDGNVGSGLSTQELIKQQKFAIDSLHEKLQNQLEKTNEFLNEKNSSQEREFIDL